MTAKKTARDGYKPYKDQNGYVIEIPEETVIGDNVTIDAIVGHGCSIGSRTWVTARGHANGDGHIGNNVRIGEDCSITVRHIGDNVRIGDRAIITGNIAINAGVIIPDDWEIPIDAGIIVINAGPEGAPVCIQKLPSCGCPGQGHFSRNSGW